MAETVLTLLEPQESGERQPPGVAGESADALGAPRIDAEAFGLQIGAGPGAGREQHRSQQNPCRGADARALIPVHGASSWQVCVVAAFYAITHRARGSPRAHPRSPGHARDAPRS